ncbi:hypothetical protein AMC99_01564 [Altererythrobacter epoxidivorans]|uniref:Lipoprotein n=1 Tax=Altererythrobacter epoxidivorans TaxID=361183 RepID=A0A0M3TAK0_9SPHN|nr:hypothetical protein [Altererythrobacter epoxidivorans]ALE16856.1 hypothetical protein AMC99_01564 [Altererythrobacter epoxidivorans]
MTIKAPRLPVLAIALACSACSVADKELAGYSDPGFGEANRATFAAMVVNPDPQYDDPNPNTSADHAVKAIERYRNDAVKKPERISTTTKIGGGGN